MLKKYIYIKTSGCIINYNNYNCKGTCINSKRWLAFFCNLFLYIVPKALERISEDFTNGMINKLNISLLL